MREIRMLTISAGPDQSPRHISKTYTVEDAEAARLVCGKFAEYTTVVPPSKAVIIPEGKAVVSPPETAVGSPAAEPAPEPEKDLEPTKAKGGRSKKGGG